MHYEFNLVKSSRRGGICERSNERCQQIHRGLPSQAPGTRRLRGELADDVAPPRLPSHLGAVGWVLDADAFGGVFVAWEYPVTVKAALLRLGLGGAPGDPEWG